MGWVRARVSAVFFNLLLSEVTDEWLDALSGSQQLAALQSLSKAIVESGIYCWVSGTVSEM